MAVNFIVENSATSIQNFTLHWCNPNKCNVNNKSINFNVGQDDDNQ